MAEQSRVVVGTVGLGGYAKSILDLVQQCAGEPDASVRLVGVFEPDLPAHAALVRDLRSKGITVTDRFDELLSLPIEGVFLPVPIDLHRAYTEQALAAGKAVLCEKPAAGCVDDCDAMIAARDAARRPALIGFQDVYDPVMLQVKQALLDSHIGKLRHATFRACWPRDSVYFSRNSWVGRFKRDGVWVMDSPAANALSHFIHLALYLLGPTLETSAVPQRVEAELYRANDIENYDTCAIRVGLEHLTAMFCMTHASAVNVDPMIVLRGEHGMIEVTYSQAFLRNRGGTQTIPRASDARSYMVAAFADVIRGRTPRTAVGTLEMARAHLVVVNGASEASVIHDVTDQFVETHASREGAATLRCIPGIDTFFRKCAHDNVMPHESGKVAWTRPAGSFDVRGYRHFSGPRLA